MNIRNNEEESIVQSVTFAAIDETVSQVETQQNIGLIENAGLDVVAELGRTKMPVKDILKLGIGTVIELDKLADEPIELRVNNKLIARGEIVAIDDYFGIRIIEIATG